MSPGNPQSQPACKEVLAGTWNFQAAGEKTLVEFTDYGAYCGELSASATFTGTVSDDLKTLTIPREGAGALVFDIAPIDSSCSPLVATLTDSVTDDYALRYRYTVNRQSDGSLSGEFETIVYAKAAGPETLDCRLTIPTTGTR